jgi:hypothetical protein
MERIRYENIARFDVAMNEAMAVQEVDCLRGFIELQTIHVSGTRLAAMIEQLTNVILSARGLILRYPLRSPFLTKGDIK